MAKNIYFTAFWKWCCVLSYPSGLYLNDVICCIPLIYCVWYCEANEGDKLILNVSGTERGFCCY